ncbi:MAG: thioredoxin family protein [bacterium]|nr:thioredoxin family protein [bacterium]
MRKFRFPILLAILGLVFTAGFTVAGNKTLDGPLSLGETAPKATVKMANIDGRELSIADVKGEHGTLVMFSCNSCPWVVAWEDRIASLGNAYQEKGFGVIVINANDTEQVAEDGLVQMKKRAEERGFNFPYVVDATSNVARAFGATRTPEVFLFNKQGKLVYNGAIDDDARNPGKVEAHYLKDALESILAGKPVSTAQTKALGCTIKFRPKS